MDGSELQAIVDRALAEDIGTGDVTTEATVDPEIRAEATITQKAPGVVYGVDVAEAVFRTLDPGVSFERLGPEAEWRESGPVLRVTGPARALLGAERTALNFLQRLSGIATLTARTVAAVTDLPRPPRILDTRKTTPGLRMLEKEAVAAGGGLNHRIGLFDAILIKENHAAIAGGVGEAVRRAHAHAPTLPIEVECETLAEVDEALAAATDTGIGDALRILLDNMTPAQLTAAVRHVAGRAELEASGGFTLATIQEVALSGVDFISVGALTHSAPALDLSLLLTPCR